MSTIKVVNVQLGQSATAANNFTLAVPSNPNGTVKLSRGNAGATSSDVISIDTSGNMVVSGNVTAFSDIRIKTDVVPITDAINKVLKLNGILYTRTDTGNRETGLIAQELIKVLPEAIVEEPDSGMLSIAYGNVVGLLVEAIKEQQKQIDELKKLIK